MAAPTIVPTTAFGVGSRAPASERITVGFIGCGKMANDYHLSTLLEFGDVQALAVCDVDRGRREHAKDRVERAYAKDAGYKGCAAYSDFRELLARGDIDAACIATPERWHAIPAIAACKAGKDVSCEKPLTCTSTSRPATTATGSTASARASALWPTWSSALDPSPSASWGTWLTGITASSIGTRRNGNS